MYCFYPIYDFDILGHYRKSGSYQPGRADPENDVNDSFYPVFLHTSKVKNTGADLSACYKCTGLGYEMAFSDNITSYSGMITWPGAIITSSKNAFKLWVYLIHELKTDEHETNNQIPGTDGNHLVHTDSLFAWPECAGPAT
jgi:hypothetical protein